MMATPKNDDNDPTQLQQQTNLTIEDQRAKSNFVFREAMAPGLDLEMQLKRIFVSTESEFQKVDVIETYFGKTLITDGKTQSAQFDEFAYHETLVHPAMLRFASTAGKGPETVFIGGGGELATAREVLRCKSVKKAVMVDIDGKVLEVCRKYMPEWGGDAVATNPRLELIIGDAYAYLMNLKEPTFDIIIMDISDPIEAGPGAMLYTQEFYQHAATLLNQPHGVFVTQSGMAESIPIATLDEHGIDPSCFAPIYNTLKTAFDCVVPYSSTIPSFGSDWGFNMAFSIPSKNGNGEPDKQVGDEVVQQWKVPPSDLIDSLIEQQIDGGADALKWYDSTTHLVMFALSKPLRKYIQQDQRVMTKENPIFMF